MPIHIQSILKSIANLKCILNSNRYFATLRGGFLRQPRSAATRCFLWLPVPLQYLARRQWLILFRSAFNRNKFGARLLGVQKRMSFL
jgi:hypothetical protein